MCKFPHLCPIPVIVLPPGFQRYIVFLQLVSGLDLSGYLSWSLAPSYSCHVMVQSYLHTKNILRGLSLVYIPVCTCRMKKPLETDKINIIAKELFVSLHLYVLLRWHVLIAMCHSKLTKAYPCGRSFRSFETGTDHDHLSKLRFPPKPKAH